MCDTQALDLPKQKSLWTSLRRRIKRLRRLRHGLNALVARYSLVGDPPVFDPAVFDWTAALEENWEAIRGEAQALIADSQEIPSLGDISPDHQRLDQKRSWRTFFLWGYTYRVDANCLRAPMTAALVDRIPGIISALFSIHEPGTHLPRHRGVTKGMITCHLGLDIPDDPSKCRIAVDDVDYGWTPGNFFIFDDTRYHEVWNDTDRNRVILLIHIRRPLRGIGRWIESIFFQLIRLSPFVQEARRNLQAK
jgi:aspartyl/asparaginyl beta-hydroxylase (cupin superfamily)